MQSLSLSLSSKEWIRTCDAIDKEDAGVSESINMVYVRAALLLLVTPTCYRFCTVLFFSLIIFSC